MSGQFIVFEGIDGSGKSTALSGVAEWLRRRGDDPIITREPGGSPRAEQLRALALSAPPLLPEAELLVMFAARCDHLHTLILPALEDGRTVLCDRFVDSSYVYQGVARGVDMAWIEDLERRVVTRRPDLTVVLDIAPERAAERLRERPGANHFDDAGEAFMRSARAGYLARARLSPEDHAVVDADQDPAAVVASIAAQFEQRGLA